LTSGVTQQKNGKWKARYRDASHVEHAKTFQLKRDAITWRGEQIASVRSGTWIDPHAHKQVFSSFAAVWLSNKETKGLKPSAIEMYRELHRKVMPKWGSLPVGVITVKMMDEWTRYLIAEEELSASRIKKLHLVVRQVLDVAVSHKALGRNPIVTKEIHRPKGNPPDPRAFTPEEAKELIQLLPEKYKLMTESLCFTGLRISEVVALKVGDIDFGKRELKVSRSTVAVGGTYYDGTPKSGKSRSVPLTDHLLTKLRAHIAGRGRGDWLFYTGDNTQMIPDTFREHFKLAAAEIGRPDMRPHGCRDTYASWAISANVPITIVSQSLGHANPSITLTFYAAYFETDYDKLRDAMSKITI
jgi:integrase